MINKIHTKFFLSFFVLTIMHSGCANIAGDKFKSSLVEEQATKNVMTNSKQSDKKNLDEVKVTFSFVDSEIVVHQPVLLNFVVQNGLGQTIKLDLGGNRKESFLFTVIFPDGRKVQLPQIRPDGFSRSGVVYIKPEESYNQSILLNEWIAFASSGRYVLEGRLANPIKSEQGEIIQVDTSFSSILKIEPKNTEHLKDISAALVQQILNSDNYTENANAALALSYVDDPTAIPYLEKLLYSNKLIEPIAISGLRRIGGENSVEVLIRFINKQPDSELARLAKTALKRIEIQSLDSKLKQKIDQFLQLKKD